MADIASLVIADDQPRVVDAPGGRALRRQRIVEGGVGAAAEEEAVGAASVLVQPGKLVKIIDAECLGGAGKGGGIVERGEAIDRHDMDSSLIVFAGRERRFGKLSRYRICLA